MELAGVRDMPWGMVHGGQGLIIEVCHDPMPSLGINILIYRQWGTAEEKEEAYESCTSLQNAGHHDRPFIQKQLTTSPTGQLLLGVSSKR